MGQRLESGPTGELGPPGVDGATALVGYRIAPWRDLEITPWLGIGRRRELAMDAPDWSRSTLSIGLTVGWLF